MVSVTLLWSSLSLPKGGSGGPFKVVSRGFAGGGAVASLPGAFPGAVNLLQDLRPSALLDISAPLWEDLQEGRRACISQEGWGCWGDTQPSPLPQTEPLSLP